VVANACTTRIGNPDWFHSRTRVSETRKGITMLWSLLLFALAVYGGIFLGKKIPALSAAK
jgi:hypothetical protein